MKEYFKGLKQELINTIKTTTLSKLTQTLEGRGGVRRNCVNIDGYYCSNCEDDFTIIDKNDLTLTIQTYEYDDEGWNYGLDIFCENGGSEDDYQGIFKYTINKHTSINLLLELLNIS
jgi:hypothetical protein